MEQEDGVTGNLGLLAAYGTGVHGKRTTDKHRSSGDRNIYCLGLEREALRDMYSYVRRTQFL